MFNDVNGVNALSKIEVGEGQLLLNWLGQAGFVIKTPAGTELCIDPYLTNSIEKYEGAESRRLWFPSFPMDRFNPDLVICTHDHLDHTDPETIPMIAAYSHAAFWGPEESCKHIAAMNVPQERIKSLKIGEEYSFQDVRIKPVFALHTPGSIGVVLGVGAFKIYITADTQFDPRLLEVKAEKPNMLITCINAKYGNLNAEEACALARELQPDVAIPMHYGLIPSNTVPPDEFKQRCDKAGVACKVLKPEQNYRCAMEARRVEVTEW